MKMLVSASITLLSLVGSVATAASCQPLAEQANLMIIKMNGEEGGNATQTTKKSKKSDGVTFETYLFYDAIPSGYTRVLIEMLHVAADGHQPRVHNF